VVPHRGAPADDRIFASAKDESFWSGFGLDLDNHREHAISSDRLRIGSLHDVNP
jgi:hypothetical protein